MPFLDFFRSIFNKEAIQEPPQNRFEDNYRYSDSFRNPIWQNDEDENEDDVSDFRHPMNRYNFKIDSNPFEMTRFFEAQMEYLLKSFFSFDGFGKNFGNHTNIFIPFEDDNFMQEFSIYDGRSNGIGPRDEVMKPEYKATDPGFANDNFTSLFALPDVKPKTKGLCDALLKPSYEILDSNSDKVDSDLDGKIKSGELAEIWKAPSTSETVQPQFSVRNFTFGKSVSTQVIRRQDGSIEERRTVKDSNGNEETSITRQIGDQQHTIIKKKAKDGSEEQTENIINMDENELKGFDKKWLGFSKTPKQSNISLEDFPWQKFFGPNPKL
ncbi:PREDICTED: uncharacterized protein LOC105364766 isoform X2 [Ceratosolen solmsi marchali]|uniref:Uncharacterized protein LOC105364766 isoform X2 n=1 Tax=Ceratosolen solmsi marchali TaxID=326594 RepID=A0AAJ7DYI6_9HYME|nr:PREDICTED: uncharacterized protein LOC105364766 isoform X2 [Ceratosolen solmsi marchali]